MVIVTKSTLEPNQSVCEQLNLRNCSRTIPCSICIEIINTARNRTCRSKARPSVLGSLGLKFFECAMLWDVKQWDPTNAIVKSNWLLFAFQGTEKVDIRLRVVVLRLSVWSEPRVTTYCLNGCQKLYKFSPSQGSMASGSHLHKRFTISEREWHFWDVETAAHVVPKM